MGGRLVATVYVLDPETHQTVRLDAGSEPEARLAALVPNPAAWEDNEPPAAKPAKSSSAKDDDSDGDKPAARKAATSPARGRKAAGEGSSG